MVTLHAPFLTKNATPNLLIINNRKTTKNKQLYMATLHGNFTGKNAAII
jgi:hypothetical protein